MIFSEPILAATDFAVLQMIDRQREHLRIFSQSAPRRWVGSLRRLSFARAMRGTNSIEGLLATLDNAVAAVDNEPMLNPRDETTLALFGYRNTLTYIMQAAADPYFELSKQFLKSLHFMMINYDMKKNPGQYRPGTIQVVNERNGETVYSAPDAELIDGLVSELVAYLRSPKTTALPVVRAAMAHLNLVMIHPFSDGNGRMSRALQTFVLAREGVLDPVFASIEEWLGANTDQYYAVLAEVGRGKWSPSNDTLTWVRFCLKAHYQQAATIIRRNDEYDRLYSLLERWVAESGLPSRCVMPLFDASLGLSLTNSRYVAFTEVESHTATRELKVLVNAGWLSAEGEKKGRRYRATEKLLAARKSTRVSKTVVDPYILLRDQDDPRLPGI